MALSNTERQRRFRTRRLGRGGIYERISCLVHISTKRSIERLACHFDCSITETIERLIIEKTASILAGLDEEGQERFYAQTETLEDEKV